LLLITINAIAGESDASGSRLVETTTPKLVVQITVDQLRGDLPMRFRERLGEGGFRYLLEQGTHFNNAHYRHANTETAVGHATLVTGADPSRHGMVSNYWFDPQTGESIYNTEDDRHHLIGKQAKPHQGVSPRNLLASTIGDELVLSNAGQSRVFSVSGKDRGAILPGGHAGKAFWYSKSSGQFVSSTYYYDEYPKWVADWNAGKPTERYRSQHWKLLQPRENYFARDLDDREYEADFGALGRTFPHGYGDDKYTNLIVGLTPAVDELTLEFVKLVIEKEKLGAGAVTDFLAVSFSATDYVGHLFGPASLETEDNILRLDRILASLFRFLDETVGLENTLIVLSADHGAPIQRQIRRNFHFDRSGSVHLVQEQYWFLHSTDEAAKMGLAGLAAIHGSPWAYDTYVPIFFAGHTVPAQKIERRVSPTDIAPTLSSYLGIKYPSGNIGDPLIEVFSGGKNSM